MAHFGQVWIYYAVVGGGMGTSSECASFFAEGYLLMQKIINAAYEKLHSHPRLVNSFILIATAVAFIVITSLTPFVYDDIVYHYCYQDGKSFFEIQPGVTPLINSWSDIFQSVKAAYFNWSGRTISMFTVYVVFWYGKIVFNLLNGVIASAVIYMICRHICGKRTITPALLLTVSSLFFLCAPSPGLTLFWANGAIIYMWTALFYLLLLYPYRVFIEYGDDKKTTWTNKIYLILPGIVGCNANENLAVSVVITLTMLIAYNFWTFRRAPVWMFYGLTGALIGALSLLLAPGHAGRIACEGYKSLPVLTNIFTQTAHVFHSIPGLLAAIIMLIIFNFRKFGKKQYGLTVFYLLLIAGSAYSMIFSPYTPGRAVFCTFIFMLCCAGNILQNLKIREHNRMIIAGIALFTALMSSAFALRDIAFTNRICKERFAIMHSAQQNKKKQEWVFRPLCGMSRYSALYKTDIIRDDPEHFLNKHYAIKYGQISVKTTTIPAVQGMELNILPRGEL